MEKRFTLALVLSVILMVAWNYFYLGPRRQAELDRQRAIAAESEAQNPTGDGDPKPVPPVTITPTPVQDEVPEEEVVISNQALRLTLTNHGATIRTAELLEFRPRADQDVPLRLLTASADGLAPLMMEDVDFPALALRSRNWAVERGAEGRSVSFSQRFTRTGTSGDLTYRVTKTFEIPEGLRSDASVSIAVRFEGEVGSGRVLQTNFALAVTAGVFQELGGETMTPPRSAMYPFEDEVEVLPVTSVAKETQDQEVLATFTDRKPNGVRFSLGSGARFVADVSNYHGAFFLLRDFPASVVAAFHTSKAGDRGDFGSDGVRTCTVLEFSAQVPQGEEVKWSGVLYLGPIQTEPLRDRLANVVTDEEVTALTSVYDDQLGWARFIGRMILWALRALHGIVGNWGWAIVLLTVCVRAILFPVNRKSQAAMMKHNQKMVALKPKLEAMKKKLADDPRKQAEAQMKLMREHGVGVPLGGCLPIFLQIPVFFGLFSALRSALELRQAPWLWVTDLSQPDHLVRFDAPVPNPLSLCGGCCGMPAGAITGFHLLPILMTIAWVVNSWLMPRPETSDPQQEQMRKMMMFMPIMFGFFMYTYAAGLSLYWLTSSVIGIIETRVIKKFWPITPVTAAVKE